MAFQFQCPNGHLLQGEESQAGQQCYCPTCQILFIIPAPPAPAAPGAGFPQIGPPGSRSPLPGSRSPLPGGFPQVGPAGKPSAAAQVLAMQMKEPDLLHIPCPKCKQVLESPLEMLDQDVICPHCQAQFTLRRRDSVEYKRKKQQEQEIRERKVGNAWLNWAIVVAVLVVLGLLILIFAGGSGE